MKFTIINLKCNSVINAVCQFNIIKLNTPQNMYMDNELQTGFIQLEKTFSNIININNTF